jgi:phage FluMu protein Com
VRVARLTLHAPTIESTMENIVHTPPALDNWQPTNIKKEENPTTAPKTQPGSSLMGNLEEDFPTCYIEEIPYTEDTPTALEPQARDKTRGRLSEDLPTCYIEEVPYMIVVSQRTYAVMVHQIDIASMDKDEASAEAEKGNPGEADTKGMHARSGAHPPFLHTAHLELVFQLRGQMADQEHISILMGQCLDMLLDAYFNALVNQKCPTCTQTFVIQERAAWQEDEDDRSPSI